MERGVSDVVATIADDGAAMAAQVLDARSLHVLRRWIRANVAGTDDALADAQMVCTELVSNGIEHAQGPWTVRMSVSRRTLTIEVDDRSPGAALTPGSSRLGEHRGRGLLIVTAMSRWGVRPGPAGKTVWAVVELG